LWFLLKTHEGTTTVTSDQIVYQQRVRVLDHARLTGNVSATCRTFGISRKTFYKWRNVAAKYGVAALMPKTRRPPGDAVARIAAGLTETERTETAALITSTTDALPEDITDRDRRLRRRLPLRSPAAHRLTCQPLAGASGHRPSEPSRPATPTP